MSLKAVVKFSNGTKQLETGAGEFVNNAVNKAILVMERNVKVNTPVLHGHLKRSIASRMTGFGQGEVFTNPIEGGVEINYAIHVEYGTKHMAPRAMFRKGIEQSKEKIMEIFADEAKKVTVSISGVK